MSTDDFFRARLGQMIDLGPASATPAVADGVISSAARPRLPIPRMVALPHLEHVHNESEESLLERWGQDMCFQFFSREVHDEQRPPSDPAQISGFPGNPTTAITDLG